MAKPKGGLGRGLNSLLGGDEENKVSKEAMVPAERIVVTEGQDKDKPSSKNIPSKTVAAAAPPARTNTPTMKEDNKPREEIYSNKEDNITIKGVVERAVEPEKPSEPKQVTKEQKEQVTVRDTDEVPIELVEPNPDQPRTNFNKEELEELAESIKRNGLLQPILVRKVGEKYQIIAGEQRWQACNLLKMETVPVRVKEVGDDDTIMLALVENIQRSDLNPIEEAYGYRRMIERGKMTQSQVAQAVSKGRSTIANALRLLELPEEAQQLLFEEKITAGHARAILSVPTKEGRVKLTEKLVKEDLSVRDTEALARLLAGKKTEKTPARSQIPKSYRTVARSLRDALDTDVRVKSVKGKNKIEIGFRDEADLERLFRIITSE